jgi:LPS-assembly lipoprotein
LSILYDFTDQRVLSVSARNVPTEFEVFYTVRYAITSGEQNLLEPQELTLTRDYTYDETLVLGKAREEQVMRDAIVDDLVRIVLKQISAI